RERRHRAARRAVAGRGVARVGGAGGGGAAAGPAAGAGVVERAGVAVVARRAGVGGHGAARRAVAGPRVARIRGTRDRRADALPAAGARVVERAGVAVVAGRARERRHRAAGRTAVGPRVALVGGPGDGVSDSLAAADAGIVDRAVVAVVAPRARELHHPPARCAVAGPRVALVRGARDGGAAALPAAGAGVVERAGVAVVARRAGV